MKADKRIISFLLIAYAITWSIAGAAYAYGITSSAEPLFIVVAALSMFGPGIAALIQQRLIDRAPWAGLGLPLKGTHWGILAATALVGMSIVPLCLLVLHILGDLAGISAFGHVSLTSERLVTALSQLGEHAGHGEEMSAQALWIARIPPGIVLLVMLLSALLASVTINLPFMLGEELGWRGYLYQRTVHWQGMRRVVFTGVVWGLWHAPLVAMGHNYPGYGVVGIGMMVVFTVLASFLFDWTRSRSRSIWSSCMLHGLINGSAGAMAIFAWAGHPLAGTVVGLGGFITMLLMIAGVLLFDRRYREILLGPQRTAEAIPPPGSPVPGNAPPDRL